MYTKCSTSLTKHTMHVQCLDSIYPTFVCCHTKSKECYINVLFICIDTLEFIYNTHEPAIKPFLLLIPAAVEILMTSHRFKYFASQTILSTNFYSKVAPWPLFKNWCTVLLEPTDKCSVVLYCE